MNSFSRWKNNGKAAVHCTSCACVITPGLLSSHIHHCRVCAKIVCGDCFAFKIKTFKACAVCFKEFASNFDTIQHHQDAREQQRILSEVRMLTTAHAQQMQKHEIIDIDINKSKRNADKAQAIISERISKMARNNNHNNDDSKQQRRHHEEHEQHNQQRIIAMGFTAEQSRQALAATQQNEVLAIEVLVGS